MTLSTMAQQQEALMQRILDAVGTLRVRAIVTLGPSLDATAFIAPPNVVLETFVPHVAVIPLVEAVVTQCGFGTIAQALACGVPLVCIPLVGDQPANAARVVARRAGVMLRPNASRDKIARAIERVISPISHQRTKLGARCKPMRALCRHTQMVPLRIRSLRAEDVELLATALAEAFRRDDMAVWIFPESRGRDAALAAMFRSRLSAALHGDETVVDVADDLSGAAIWQSPHVRLDDDPPPGARSDVVEAFRTLYAACPQQPYWYLHGIGARIEHRGIGSALMKVGLRRWDETGVPSALWTGAERNLAFYRKHGYRELQRFDFPGASAWWMWRDPA